MSGLSMRAIFVTSRCARAAEKSGYKLPKSMMCGVDRPE
jgi:hypothetical protein